jgi:hypothetical protein
MLVYVKGMQPSRVLAPLDSVTEFGHNLSHGGITLVATLTTLATRCTPDR